MGFRKRIEVTTQELQKGDTVLMRNDEPWEVLLISMDDRVTIQNGTRTATGRQDKWTVLREVDTTDHLTVQEYLIGCGLEPDRLETAAKTFGTVLAAQFRKRHGKDAKPVKKLEYVPYLDELGPGQCEEYEGVNRKRQWGWYESNAYAPSDIDLMDAVKAARLPSLGPYQTPEERAVEVLQAHGLSADHIQQAGEHVNGGVLWLAEDRIKRCLASGVVCGHEACAKRRGAQWRSPGPERREDMFG